MKTYLRVLAAVLLTVMLTGCGHVKDYLPTHSGPEPSPTRQIQTEAPTTAPTVSATIPADGNPDDVTCKGSYTGQPDSSAVAARIGDTVLTNDQLSAYYWAAVAQYLHSGQTPAPDPARPLDTQPCEIDVSVSTWQQFFLRQALNTWHSAQALVLQGAEEGLPVEEAFQPNQKNYEKYLTDIPATKYLYRYETAFQPNSMHQAFLDAIPETLETLAGDKGYGGAQDMAQKAFGISSDALAAMMETYNRGYMYFTNLTYYVAPGEEAVEAAKRDLSMAGVLESGNYVDIRHILLIPEGASQGADGTVTCSEEDWTACEEQAQALLDKWAKPNNKPTEATFATMAFRNSQDAGTALDGGAYRRIQKGQLMDALDAWCFSPERQAGDTGILRSPYGVHILYFTGSTSIAQIQSEDAAKEAGQTELLELAREAYPMAVDYSAIELSEGEGTVSLSDLLYPDVAHERFPEIPLYLQQDYPETKYGAYPIRTHGCGITTMSMVASFFADEELTPAIMCARYGKYSYAHGTDGALFEKEPPVLGFYLREKTYENTTAKAALEEGQIVVCLQQKGYWTRGGHYLALEKIFEDGMVQVRDSNIFNYGKLPAHKEDKHTWQSIIGAVSGYWIYEDKVTYIPACSRCGSEEGHTRDFLAEDYVCHKCAPALMRRNTYLMGCGN